MSEKVKIKSKKVSVFYGDKKALDSINLEIPEKKVTSLIGPSGCGKSTFLRCLNRMNDTIDICRIEGEIFFRKMLHQGGKFQMEGINYEIILRQNVKERSDGEIDKGVVPIPGDSTF